MMRHFYFLGLPLGLPLVLSGCATDPNCGPGTHAAEGVCLPDADAPDTGDAGDTAADTDSGDTDTDTGADTASDTGDDTATDTGADWTVCDDGVAPYADIQAAVDDASEGDTITVCAGTYSFVELDRHGVTLVGAGAAVTFIDGGSTHTAVTADGVSLSISGFTLTGSGSDSLPAALYLASSSGRVADVWFVGSKTGRFYAAFQRNSDVEWEHVLFDGNTPGGLGAGFGGDVVVRHSVFRNNGGTIAFGTNSLDSLEFSNNLLYANTVSNSVASFDGPSSPWVFNNTFYGNMGNGAFVTYAVTLYPEVVFENNILADNSGTLGGVTISTDFQVDYNDSHGNTYENYLYSGGETIGTNLESDPHFSNEGAEDFTLDGGFSPCVNAGNPLAGYNDVDGARNDMGAFGGPYGEWTPL